MRAAVDLPDRAIRIAEGVRIVAREKSRDVRRHIGPDRQARIGVRSVTYAEAVEAALCYGWIDGQGKRLDDDYYLQRFTPRREEHVVEDQPGEGHRADRIGAMRPAECAKSNAHKPTVAGMPRTTRRSLRRSRRRWNSGYARTPRPARSSSRSTAATALRSCTASRPRRRGDRRTWRREVLRDVEERRDDLPAALTDWNAFEDRGAHARLRQLGQKLLGVDECTQAVHARSFQPRTRPAAQVRRQRPRAPHRQPPMSVRRRRRRHSRIRCRGCPTLRRAAPHFAVVTESTPQPCSLRGLSQEHADSGNAGERVDNQRGPASHERAVVATDRIGEPHECLAVRMFLPPAVVVPRPNRTLAGRDGRRPHCSGPPADARGAGSRRPIGTSRRRGRASTH